MVYVIIFYGVLCLDQLTKAIVDLNNSNIEIIRNVLYITNARNSGAAFGMMSDQPAAMALFISLTLLSMAAIGTYFVLRKHDSKWLNISLAFIASGAIGNLVDRLAFKEVRDFINVTFFANFNVADIGVSVGAIMMIIYFLFLDKEAVFRKKPADKKEDKNESK